MTTSIKACRRYRRVAISYTVVREPGATARPRLSSPEEVVRLAQELVAACDDDREHFWAIFLDAQNMYTSHHLVSTGSLSASIVHPREVLGPAIREGAAHLVLVHNHPSGDPTPSKEDRVLTQTLVSGARLLGLRIHDHVIIGNGSGKWTSLAAKGLFVISADRMSPAVMLRTTVLHRTMLYEVLVDGSPVWSRSESTHTRYARRRLAALEQARVGDQHRRAREESA